MAAMNAQEAGARRASVVVTTYNSPDTLALVLLALARQDTIPSEVIVADDGSDERTAERLVTIVSECPFRLVHVHQPDSGFRAARNRNNAIHIAREDFIAFLDQDTLPHHDWLSAHLTHVKSGCAGIGYVLGLPEAGIAGGTLPDSVRTGAFETSHGDSEIDALAALHRKYTIYARLRRLGLGIPGRPKLGSGNFSAFRDDLARVNGFDEEYVGWGQEDDDLGRRLYRTGIRPVVLVTNARVSHVPHPLRHRREWKEGANVDRFSRRDLPSRCERGLDSHPHGDVRVTEPGPAAVSA